MDDDSHDSENESDDDNDANDDDDGMDQEEEVPAPASSSLSKKIVESEESVQKTAPATTKTAHVAASSSSSSPPAAPDLTPAPVVVKKKKNMMEIVFDLMLHASAPFDMKTLERRSKFPAAALSGILEKMEVKKFVKSKEFGKVTLYWVNQTCERAQPRKVSEKEVGVVEKKVQDLQQEIAQKEKELNEIKSQPLNTNLDDNLAIVEDEVTALREKVERSRNAASAQKITPIKKTLMGKNVDAGKSAAQLAREKCPRRMKIRINSMRKSWIDTKRKCMDFVENLADGLDKKTKETLNIVGIETDENEGVAIPDLKLIEEKH